MSASCGANDSLECEIADLECRLRFVSCRVNEWRTYGNTGDHDVCRAFRKYICVEVEKQIMVDVKLSDILIHRSEAASHRVPQNWANVKPFHVVAEKLDRHIAAAGRHLECWRDNAVYLATDYVDAYCMEALLDLVRDEADTLLQRAAELRTAETELRGIIGTANSLGPSGPSLFIFTTQPAKLSKIGAPSNYSAQFVSALATPGCHTFRAPQRVKRESAM